MAKRIHRSSRPVHVIAAEELHSLVESACGDMAYDAVHCPGIYDGPLPDCEDQEGALADRFYDDEEFVDQMLGDRLWDWHEKHHVAILIELACNYHGPVGAAAERRVAEVCCEQYGHDYGDHSHAGPDSGDVCLICRCCGHQHYVVLY